MARAREPASVPRRPRRASLGRSPDFASANERLDFTVAGTVPDFHRVPYSSDGRGGRRTPNDAYSVVTRCESIRGAKARANCAGQTVGCGCSGFSAPSVGPTPSAGPAPSASSKSAVIDAAPASRITPKHHNIVG